MSSTTMAATGADFTQIPAETRELAGRLGIEIIGCEKGFNAWKDDTTLSEDCTPAELRQWLWGYANGKDDAPLATDFTATALEVPADEIASALATSNGYGWKLEVTGEEITVTGRKFKKTVTGWPAFLAFIKGFESACYTHDLVFDSIEQFEAGIPSAGTNVGAA